jgi:Hormone-sensitive lipase (HSL) N-terminus
MIGDLEEIAKDNLDYFHAVKAGSASKFCELFLKIIDTGSKARSRVDQIRELAPAYDVDKESPGNGYWSFVQVFDKAVEKALKLSKDIQAKRSSIFFRAKSFEK